MGSSVRLSLEPDYPAVVHGPVHDRGGHVRVAEHASPAAGLDVRGVDHALPLVRVDCNLEQEPGSLLVDRHVAELADHEEPGLGYWIGNGVLDGFLEDESLFGEFLRAPVSEGGVEPPVVGPTHVVVEVMPQLLDRGVVVPVHELLLRRPVRRFCHGVVVGVALARQRSFDVEHVEQLVDPRVVEPAAPVGVEHLDVRRREVEGGERAQYQARVPGPPGGMDGDAPVRQAGQQAHVRPPVADPHVGKVARRMRVRGVAFGPAGPAGSRACLVGPRPVRFGPSARVRARHALFAHDVADASPGRGDTPSFPGRP